MVQYLRARFCWYTPDGENTGPLNSNIFVYNLATMCRCTFQVRNWTFPFSAASEFCYQYVHIAKAGYNSKATFGSILFLLSSKRVSSKFRFENLPQLEIR